MAFPPNRVLRRLNWWYRGSPGGAMRDGHLKYYDYGATIFLLLEILIYSDDHHHKISCGYIITDHNSTVPWRSSEWGEMKPSEIRKKKKKLISISSGIVCGLSTIESTGLLYEMKLSGCFEMSTSRIIAAWRNVHSSPLISTKVDHKLWSNEDCWRFWFHLRPDYFFRWDIIITEKSFS